MQNNHPQIHSIIQLLSLEKTDYGFGLVAPMATVFE